MNISYFVVFSFEIIELTASVDCDNGRKKTISKLQKKNMKCIFYCGCCFLRILNISFIFFILWKKHFILFSFKVFVTFDC